MELTKEELMLSIKEAHLNLINANEIVDDKVLTEILKFVGGPCNLSVTVSKGSVRIFVYNHEINIFNDTFGEDRFVYAPKLSWFSSSATPDDVKMLRYLEVLGCVASDMANPLGFVRMQLPLLLAELNPYNDAIDALYEIQANLRKLLIADNIKKQEEEDLYVQGMLKVGVTVVDKSYKIGNGPYAYRARVEINVIKVTKKGLTAEITNGLFDDNKIRLLENYTKVKFAQLYRRQLLYLK